MLTYPEIDPVAVSLGPMKIHWYGLMYLVGFAGGWWLAKLRAKRPGSGWDPEEIGDLVFYIALGVVLGGRIGYVLFYNFPVFAENPLTIFKIWQGGMSFHGGLIGVLIAFWLYARKTGRGFFNVADLIAPVVPIGLGAGRLGNFINGELWGRVTDVPWGMVFPGGGPLPRHPSQLYQFFLEGPLFFALIWLYSKKPRPTMAVSGFFLIYYGIYRFLIEFVREPDSQLGFVALDWMTQGQLLSLPMIAFGVLFIWLASRRKPADQEA
ncbi:prolipoprotein diacylglyceryl transferase [Granulosicoccaceae sp. 1_MG-2023]|nr:prolipoprotein diacylglyceryl transferase [Granulosicoccaceae sp. 1_MG-2023]